MLVGRVPFDDKSIPSILVKHLTEPPPPPSTLRGDIPPAVEALVLRCLEKDPEKRVQSADDLGRTLSGLMDTKSRPSLDPTMAMDFTPEMEPTVATQSTMAGGAAAPAAFVPRVPPPPPPAPSATNRMESGTVRAREVKRATPPPIVVKPTRSRAGLVVFAAIVVGFLAVLATGAFLVLRLSGGSSPETTTAGAAMTVPDASPLEPESQPPSDAEPPEPTGPTAAADSADAPEPEPEPAKATEPAPRRADASPPPSTPKVRPATSEPSTSPSPQPAPQEEPIPEKPAVLIECSGVPDACAAMRQTLREALDQRGMPAARPARADVILTVQAEEIGSRSETQFGNTFVVRDYSVTVEAEAPRFGDSTPLTEKTFSFDPRFGRDKLRAEAYVIANAAADKVARYWETQRAR
jgi:serine/threonine-protein kinase